MTPNPGSGGGSITTIAPKRYFLPQGETGTVDFYGWVQVPMTSDAMVRMNLCKMYVSATDTGTVYEEIPVIGGSTPYYEQ